jgi:hypothetical protein
MPTKEEMKLSILSFATTYKENDPKNAERLNFIADKFYNVGRASEVGVEPGVMPHEVVGGGHWQKEQPSKPCLFIARNEYGHQSTLHYARLDDNILCVYDDNEVFITTMEDFIDDEYFIVEYL